MKIGEIKRQALMLIFPELELQVNEQDDDSLKDLLNSLRCDPSIKSYLDASIPAINRALGRIENCGATKTEGRLISTSELEYQNGGYRLNLDTLDNALYIKEIYKDGEKIQFSKIERDAILIKGKGKLKVYYKPRLARITNATEEGYELNLPRDVAEIIPYFIKSELVGDNDREGAKVALDEFNLHLSLLADKEEYDKVLTLYQIGL